MLKTIKFMRKQRNTSILIQKLKQTNFNLNKKLPMKNLGAENIDLNQKYIT
jgi:hypothetical protein